jgi:bacillithiol system protein YtxJ
LIAGAPLDADIYLLRIQAARAVSDEIERRLRVRHESPQVLLIQDGQVVWSASHFRVTAAAVLAALEAAAAHQ